MRDNSFALDGYGGYSNEIISRSFEICKPYEITRSFQMVTVKLFKRDNQSFV